MPDVTLSVYKPADRKFYYCQWIDPTTKKPVTRSTKKKDEREAYHEAKIIQARELAESSAPTRTTWEDLKAAYKASQFPGSVRRQRRRPRRRFGRSI